MNPAMSLAGKTFLPKRFARSAPACLAINAARAQQMPHVVIVGHLSDLKSIRRTFGLVAKFYGATILTPDDGGSATAIGALLSTDQSLRTGA